MRLLLRLFPLLCAFLFFGTGSSHALQAVRALQSSNDHTAVRLTRARLGHGPAASQKAPEVLLACEQADLPDIGEDDDESPTAADCLAAAAPAPALRTKIPATALSRPPTYQAYEKHFAFSATPRFLALRVFRI